MRRPAWSKIERKRARRRAQFQKMHRRGTDVLVARPYLVRILPWRGSGRLGTVIEELLDGARVAERYAGLVVGEAVVH